VPERIIFNGEPGSTWTNNTERVRYQFVCSLINTCSACLQYHLAIGPWWPIPIHRRCRCRQVPVAVGAPAPYPFVDFRKLLDELLPQFHMRGGKRVLIRQHAAAIGAGNYRLLKAGVVKWDEIVTKYRVRTLREVVAVNKVSLKTMLKAGVKPSVAETAHAAVHTPEAELVRQHREQLIQKITAAGVPQKALVEELARGLFSRVGIVGGAAGPQSLATFARASHAEMLARLLAVWRPAPPPKPKRKKKPKPEPNGEEPKP
jgi:hypothetical protein